MKLTLVIPETEYIDMIQRLLPWYNFALASNFIDEIPAHKRRSFFGRITWNYKSTRIWKLRVSLAPEETFTNTTGSPDSRD